MSKKYNVLWIDDQHESMSNLHKTATDFEVKLWPYKSMNGGCKELEGNLPKYDAVMLDAKFFENEGDNPGTEDTQWIYDTKDRIRDLDKSLQYFVLTGQARTYDSQEFNKAFKNVFEKGKDEDEDELFLMLIDACKNREFTQLKHKYPNAFAVCDDNYLGSKQFERVLQLIKDIETPENITNQQDALLPMRKILEALFEKLHKIGLIPDEIQNEKGAINGASRFLAGNDYKYKYHKELIHPAVSVSIHHLINLTQDASHNEGNKLGVDTYLTISKNTFLYQALCYSMLEVLDYIKPYIDKNIDIVENKSKWELIKENTTSSNVNWITGTVVRIATNGYGTFRDENSSPTISIMPSLVKEHKLEENQKVEVITMPSSDSSKIFIKEIRVSL